MDLVLGGLLGGCLGRARAFDHAHDVGLLHDQELLAVDLHFGAGPLAEQDALAGLELGRRDLAILVAAAGAHSHVFALLWFLLDGVGNDDAALRLILGLDPADDAAIV